MERHIVAKFESHAAAEAAAMKLSANFPGNVSLASSTPHENWWEQGKWIEGSLATVGGIVNLVSNVLPGFGLMFMGGPMDGVFQGKMLARWLEANPQQAPAADAGGSFVIVVTDSTHASEVEERLRDLGGRHIHAVGPGSDAKGRA